MRKNKLSELSNEELLKNEKTLKTVNAMLIGAVGLLFVANIVLTFIKGFNTLSVVPIALFPIVVVNLNSLKAMKAEIKLRKL